MRMLGRFGALHDYGRIVTGTSHGGRRNGMGNELKAYQDANHPGNKIRPRVRCLGCGTKGCITAWGDWCFSCNVARMDRINVSMEKIRKALDASPIEADRGD